VLTFLPLSFLTPQTAPTTWWNADHGTWALVFVGIAGTIAAVVTIIILIRQTRVARQAAEAAVAAESAWVTVEIEWPETKGNIIYGDAVIQGQPTGTTTWFTLNCKRQNHGKTPAWVTETNIGIHITDTLPKEPDMRLTWPFQPGMETLVAGGQSTLKQLQLQTNGRPEPGKITVVYGFVKYADVFGHTNRETTFAYYIKPDRTFERISLPGWNKHI